MEKNYYEDLIDKISNLIKEDKKKDALDLVMDELKMPYIPEIYEVEFINLANALKTDLMPDKAGTSVSKDVALEYLISENEEQEAIALELLSDHNLRYDVELLKKRLETWPVEKNMLKAYLFELLVEQQIDVDINFNGMIMNPQKNGSILNDPEVKVAMDELEVLIDKNPSALRVAEEELQRFLLMSYPATPEDGKVLAGNIVKIVENMFDDKVELTDIQKRIKGFMSK